MTNNIFDLLVLLQFEVVEDWMEDLVNKSLARRTVKSEDVLGTFYSVHNLQLTFLQEQARDLEALHKKLVGRYSNVYKGEKHSKDTVESFLCLQSLGRG